MKTMAQFKEGKFYYMRSLCDYDCVWVYKVVKRTACTVTIDDGRGNRKTCRISKHSEHWNEEQISPLGVFSMSPTLCAGKTCRGFKMK